MKKPLQSFKYKTSNYVILCSSNKQFSYSNYITPTKLYCSQSHHPHYTNLCSICGCVGFFIIIGNTQEQNAVACMQDAPTRRITACTAAGGEVVVQLLNCVASWTEKLTFQKLLSPLSLCSAVTHVHLRLCFHFFYFFTEYTCQVPTKFTFKYQNV